MMERIPEEELMLDAAQAQVYADADFEQPHSMFIELFREVFTVVADGAYVLDLGCGPGDITFRFARAWPQCTLCGVDGSEAMLLQAQQVFEREPLLRQRVSFCRGMLPELTLPRPHYDIIISNSLLHHLPDPSVLWKTIRECARPEALVFIMDLKRPDSIAEAARLRDVYAQGEPEQLRRDFYNSLLAAFEPGEIQEQLRAAGLTGLSVRSVSDRHVIISGRMRG